jgi:hypothetical protein
MRPLGLLAGLPESTDPNSPEIGARKSLAIGHASSASASPTSLPRNRTSDGRALRKDALGSSDS